MRFKILGILTLLGINSLYAQNIEYLGNFPLSYKNGINVPLNFNNTATKIGISKETYKGILRKNTEEKSYIEDFFNRRLQDLGIPQTLHLYGYDFFTNTEGEEEKVSTVAVPISENYTLGPGDEIYLFFIGAPPNSDIPSVLDLEVDKNGKIYIPNYGVFYVWGLTLSQLEKLLRSSLGVNLKLSLGKLRNFPVYISGEVEKPGAVIVTAANTLIDALYKAGGVKKSGSLRNILITKTTPKGIERKKVDLYKLLIWGLPVDLRLTPGEIILVNPIGKVAAVAGSVRRPAIYELSGNETLKDIIGYAGGLLPSAYKYKVIIQRYNKNKNLEVIEGNLEDRNFLNQKVYDGDLVIIKNIKDISTNAVYLEGYAAYTGPIEYKKGLKLSNIVNSQILLPNTDLNYAELDRFDIKTLQLKKIIKFRPIDVLNGKYDMELQPLDKIVLFPKYAFKPVKVTGDVLNPSEIPYKANMKLSEALSGVRFSKPVKDLKAIIYRSVDFANATERFASTFNEENTKVVAYKTVYLYNLLQESNEKADITLKPGDVIVISPIKKNEVVLKVYIGGFVKRPGVYKISENTTLYDLLKAAGGFKPGAYPEGLVLLRKSIAKMQREKLKKAIILMKQTLEKEEAGIMQADLSKSQVEAYKYAFEAKRRLLQEMMQTQVTGRLVGLKIPKNIEALKHSPYNVVLENGDKIYVPKVPSAVLVFGEVYNPSAIVYRPNLTVKDYIQLAGGFTKYADIENVFVIKANGEAISSQTDKSLIEWDSQQKRFVWGFAYNDILDYKLKPGDAIIVPTKVKVPIFWRPLIKDVVQIIYQSALTVYTISKL